jgi:hypothetical protein
VSLTSPGKEKAEEKINKDSMEREDGIEISPESEMTEFVTMN